MPENTVNAVRVSKTVKCLEYTCYILLMFIVVPIKINHIEQDLGYGEYLKQFNKTNSDSENYKIRLEAYKKSLDGISIYNKHRLNSSALYGLTKFSDLLPEEFLNTHLVPNLPTYQDKIKDKIPKIPPSKKLKVPLKVDWREKNVVTEVQNQRGCGACWALAAIEITESMQAIKTGKLSRFSVQQMIDCASNNDGCNGGDIFLLLDWLKSRNVTIVNEDEYPNEFVNGKCKRTSAEGIKIKDFECGDFVNSEELIVELLANYGPVAVAINALSWQNYVSGVIQFHCDGSSVNLNHAVQIVGYDMSGEIPHYIVRNSWGPDFGDHGYLYIAMGGNICGIAEEVCIVEL